MHKSFLKIYILFFSMLLGSFLSVQAQRIHKVAVLGLDATGMDATVADGITEYLREQINGSQLIEVMENKLVLNRLKEFSYLTGPFTENEEIIKIGQILEVDKIVAGNIGKIGDLFSISLKCYDTRTKESYEETGSYEGSQALFLVNTIDPLAKKIIDYILEDEESKITSEPISIPESGITKPWYKKWWFWAGAGSVAVISSALALSGGGSEGGKKTTEILPDPPPLPNP
ncbi:hypothetical protein JW964_11910 [candidate division KSB1 bacterium]|nr:hypothetical protein [candidate division KSB1 bacterium]